ncbi:MAG: acetate kinase, partial [Acidobacteriota bacterium]|nr:acetate kinase [Acidobacteriota bacterium]
AADQGNARAVLARDLLTYDVRKFIGSYIAVLDGVDAITFTAGIGTNSPRLRTEVCRHLTYLGLELDEQANTEGSGERLISSPGSKVAVAVVPTNEELMIARETVK